MKKTLFLVFVFISTIVFSQDQPVDVPQIGVKIPLGETIHFKDVVVKFLEVVEDSRCPKYTNCIWAGQAIVLVEVTEKGKASEKVTITFDGKQDTTILSSEKLMLKGMSLTPYPEAEDNGERAYALVVSEEKK